MDGAGRRRRTTTACVTGAGGFVASWLVKLLLSRGGGRYAVHGTVRDPGDAKNAHLAALDGAAERLRLFKADLLDYGSMAAAIAGCDAVFHVACPVLANHTPNPEADLIAPAVTGTMNVLKACSEAKVKRVVMVSSVAAVMVNPSWPEGKPMDEDCWSDVDYCRTTENWDFLSKRIFCPKGPPAERYCQKGLSADKNVKKDPLTSGGRCGRRHVAPAATR